MTGADVALLRLAERLPDARFAELASESPTVGTRCTVVGYGRHNTDKDAASVESRVTDWSYNEQRAADVVVSQKDREDAFSAQGVDGAHSRGDSGGPLFCNGKVAGVVSCSPDRSKSVLELRKVYADVQAARDFIAKKVDEWSATPLSRGDAGAGDAGDAGGDAGLDASAPTVRDAGVDASR
jgi:hypothetical protein